jgi:hypothetical protein
MKTKMFKTPIFLLTIILALTSMSIQQSSGDPPAELETYEPPFTTERTFNGCTEAACAYCMESIDKTYTYCARCVNGQLKVPNEGKLKFLQL